LSGYYVIPQWHVRTQRILYWDRFSRPTVTPKNGTSIAYWWYDAAKAARLEAARAAQQPSGSADTQRTPGLATGVAVLAGLGLLGFFVFRRIWRRTGRA
jgi:microcin C transport system substrate-binding protein